MNKEYAILQEGEALPFFSPAPFLKSKMWYDCQKRKTDYPVRNAKTRILSLMILRYGAVGAV